MLLPLVAERVRVETDRMGSFDDAMATIQADHDAQAAQIVDLQAQLADCQSGGDVKPPTERVLFECNFADLPVGAFTQAMGNEKFGIDLPNSWWSERNCSIMESDGIHVFSVKLKAGTIGGGSGPVFFTELPDEVVEATFQMEHQFAPGFELDMGGKLPGLGSTNDPNISPPSGGSEPTNGCTMRHMWRTGGEAGSRPPGAAATYNYHPDKSSDQWGDYEFLEANFTVGEWDLITTRVHYGDPGVANGVLQSRKGYDEGPWTLDLDDYLWRPEGGDDWLINRFCMSVFRGGNTDDWASAKDGIVQFRMFKVTTPA
jgi:Polysaccharide lyase 14